MQLKPWQELQQAVCCAFTVVDGKAEETVGSGSVRGNGDIKSPNFLIECKQRTKKNITIDQDQWNKIKKEALLLGRIPALVCENESKERIISMKLTDLVEFIENKVAQPYDGR